MDTAIKRFKKHLLQYFKAEKTNALVIAGIGLMGILVSVICMLIWSGLFWKGLSASLGLIGLAELIVGFVLFLRNGAKIESIKGALSYTPKRVIAEEVSRMKALKKTLVVIRNLETAFVFVGMILCFLWMSNFLGDFSFGTGVGLIVQSALLLVMHIMAEWRADIYAHHLHKVNDRF